MALAAGTRLGVYEITAPLGEGGMGEVYRARDTKLGRDVAIKVVLEAFVADRDRLARFEREARALAALNHPNIATLHGMEEANGRHFLVMELVPGQTLAELIESGHPEAERASARLRDSDSAAPRGGGAPRDSNKDDASGLDVRKALPIALQIAEALEAAHERGVVHRDLKPANVKITPDDKVKVLDFGLAKAGADDTTASPSTLANSPTLTAMGTQAGMILGTASYMSPEQARGQSGDHRSDVFSFGVVLYEMLTGRQPFQGDTVSDVLASVLAREPGLSALPSNLPPRLVELVKRCLEKQPKRRWQAIGDVRHELEVISAHPDSSPWAAGPGGGSATQWAGEPGAGPLAHPHAIATPRPLWRRALPVAAGVVLAAALTAAAFIATRPAPPPPPTRTSFSFDFPPGTQRQGGIRKAMALSPDGARVAFVASREIWIRELSEIEPRRLARGPVANNSSTPMNLAFSPNGKSIAYWDLGDDAIHRIEIDGGAAVRVTAARNPNGITWYGDFLYYTVQGGLMRVRASGGAEPEMIVKNDPSLFQTAPHVLDDGSLLYSTAEGGEGTDRWMSAGIVRLRPGETAPTVLVQGGSDPRYLASGHLVYQLSGKLIARTFHPQSGVVGEPMAVVEGVMRGSTPIGAGLGWFEIARNGTLVYLPGPVGVAELDLKLAWFDRAGKAEVLPIPAGPYAHPRISPDRRKVAFSRIDNGQYSVYVYDLGAGGSPQRLTFGGRERFPMWSHDSQWVIYGVVGGDEQGIFRQRADGSSPAERLTTAAKDTYHAPESGSPDGAVLIYTESRNRPTSELMVYSFKDRKSSPVPGGKTQFKAGAAFSADGKWVAYSIRGQDSSLVTPFVQPYPFTGARYQLYDARQSGHSPAWSPDGRELFFTSGPGQTLDTLKVSTSPSFTFVPGETVTRPFLNLPPNLGRPFDVVDSPTGVRFLGLMRPTADLVADSEAFRVVLKWGEELKGRVR